MIRAICPRYEGKIGASLRACKYCCTNAGFPLVMWALVVALVACKGDSKGSHDTKAGELTESGTKHRDKAQRAEKSEQPYVHKTCPIERRDNSGDYYLDCECGCCGGGDSPYEGLSMEEDLALTPEESKERKLKWLDARAYSTIWVGSQKALDAKKKATRNLDGCENQGCSQGMVWRVCNP